VASQSGRVVKRADSQTLDVVRSECVPFHQVQCPIDCGMGPPTHRVDFVMCFQNLP
jgi:hypothetical protein